MAPGPASTLVLPELELLEEVVVLLPELLEDVVVLLPELELLEDELWLDDEPVDDVGNPELVLTEELETLELPVPVEAEAETVTVAVVVDDVPEVADVLDAVALEVEALDTEAVDDELVLLELPVVGLPLDAVVEPADEGPDEVADTAVEAAPPLEDDELELLPLLKHPGTASSSAQMSARLLPSMFPSGEKRDASTAERRHRR